MYYITNCCCFTCRKGSSCCSSSWSPWTFSSRDLIRTYKEENSSSMFSTEILHEHRRKTIKKHLYLLLHINWRTVLSVSDIPYIAKKKKYVAWFWWMHFQTVKNVDRRKKCFHDLSPEGRREEQFSAVQYLHWQHTEMTLWSWQSLRLCCEYNSCSTPKLDVSLVNEAVLGLYQ